MRRWRDPTRNKQSKLLRGLFDGQFTKDLDIDFNPKKPRQFGYPSPSQVLASQPATASTHNLDTPSPSTINSTTLPTTLYGASLAGTLDPPAVGRQSIPSPVSNLLDPNTRFLNHEQGSTSGAFTIMDPNDIDDYGYAPNGSNQGTSDFGFGTAYTGAYPNSPSTGGWNTQGQHRYPVQTPNTPNTFGQQAWGVTQNQYHVDSFPVQTPNTPHTFSRQTLEQQLQPSPNSAPPQTIKIRGLNQEGRYTNARLNPTMRRSYITLSFAASLGFSLDDLLPFQPGNYGEEWTRDGGPAPSRWVTVNIAGHGPFRFQETRENVAIYPLSESPGSNAGLIMGWELWQKLYPQQGDGNDPAPGSRHHTN